MKKSEIGLWAVVVAMVIAVVVGYWTTSVVQLMVDLWWPVLIGAVMIIAITIWLATTAGRRPINPAHAQLIFRLSMGGLLGFGVGLVVFEPQSLTFVLILLGAFVSLVGTILSFGVQTTDRTAAENQ